MKKKHIFILIIFSLNILYLFIRNNNITGAFVDTNIILSPSTIIFEILVFLLLISLLLIQEKGSIDELVSEIHLMINKQKEKYRSNQKYIKGLKEIEDRVNEDLNEYNKIFCNTEQESFLQKNIYKRLEKRKDGLIRRENYFFELPHHLTQKNKNDELTQLDLPDKGLYNYAPLLGKKSKLIKIKIIHYTPHDNYEKIKENFENGKKEVLIKDIDGWVYFISDYLPARLNIKTARAILGTGKQEYTGRKENRNPEYEIDLTVLVNKERILTKESYYNKQTTKEITINDYRTLNESEKKDFIKVKKYAIAGGITQKDIIDAPSGKRYVDKNLPEHHSNKIKENWKKIFRDNQI